MAGQPFNHLLYHLTLTYSNWEWGQVCFSESYENLAEGVQQALWELVGCRESTARIRFRRRQTAA